MDGETIANIIMFVIPAVFIYAVVMRVIDTTKNVKSAVTHKAKKKEMPIFTVENIGKEYIALGHVSSSANYRSRAEVDIIEQAQKMGADAIVGCSATSSTSTEVKSSVDRGPFGLANNQKVDSSSTTTYYFSGTAVKFKD